MTHTGRYNTGETSQAVLERYTRMSVFQIYDGRPTDFWLLQFFYKNEIVGGIHRKIKTMLEDEALLSKLSKFPAFRQEMAAYSVIEEWETNRLEPFVRWQRNRYENGLRVLHDALEKQPGQRDAIEREAVQRFREWRNDSNEPRVAEAMDHLVKTAADGISSLVVDEIRRCGGIPPVEEVLMMMMM
jgi:hypothetical protein